MVVPVFEIGVSILPLSWQFGLILDQPQHKVLAIGPLRFVVAW